MDCADDFPHSKDEISSDEEFSVKKHATLIKNAAAAYGKKFQRIQAPDRNEPSIEVSEFHLSDKIKTKQTLTKSLASSLEKVGKHSHIAQKVRKLQSSSKPLPAPLERPEAEKIKRTVAYENTKNLLARWEPVVTTNKVTAELHFPLNTPYFRMASTKDFIANYKPKSDLEKEVDKILSGISGEKDGKEKPEPRKTFFLNRKEILEQRRELARIRAQQSYREARARRQNKIKSKKYHRILRRERTKKQIQEFEKLQKTDPEAALKKLEELEKTRAEERVSLRHRSTGQWARNKAVHAKYDKESRQQLHQQLRMSRDLTMKVNKEDSSEGEDIEEDHPVSEDNPWMKGTNEYEEFSNKYRKYWEEENAKKSKSKENAKASESREEVEEIESVTSVRDENKSHKSMIMKNNVEDPLKSGLSVTEIDRKFINNEKKRSFNDYWECTSFGNSSKQKNVKLNGVTCNGVICNGAKRNGFIYNGVKRNGFKDVEDMFEHMENMIKKKFEKKASELKGGQAASQPKKKMHNKKKDEAVNVFESEVKEDPSQGAINLETTSDAMNKWNVTPINGLHLKLNGQIKSIAAASSKAKIDDLEINPSNFIQINEKHLRNTQVPDIIANEEDNTPESEKEKLMTISEAFMDDDVVAEFRQEKEAIADKDKPKDVDLTLPGWGEWAGKGIPDRKRRKKRFVIKAPKYISRKDDKKDSVIINEASDAKARAHQVSELPHPYIAVESFESSIRAPLGSTWVPETAHRKFIAPKIKTLIGTVIEPLSEEALIDNSESLKHFDEKEVVCEVY